MLMLRVPRWLQVVARSVFAHCLLSAGPERKHMGNSFLPHLKCYLFPNCKILLLGRSAPGVGLRGTGWCKRPQREGLLKWVNYGGGVEGKGSTVLKSCPSGGAVEKDEASSPGLGRTCVRAGGWPLSPAQQPHHHGSAPAPCTALPGLWAVPLRVNGAAYIQRTAFPFVGVTDEFKSCSSLGKIIFTFFPPSFVCYPRGSTSWWKSSASSSDACPWLCSHTHLWSKTPLMNWSLPVDTEVPSFPATRTKLRCAGVTPVTAPSLPYRSCFQREERGLKGLAQHSAVIFDFPPLRRRWGKRKQHETSPFLVYQSLLFAGERLPVRLLANRPLVQISLGLEARNWA